MGYCTSYGKGLYVASEGSVAAWDSSTRPGAGRAVLNGIGSHGLALGVLSEDTPRARALADAGYVVAVGDMGQTTTQGTFGNDTAQARLASLRTWIQGATSPLAAASGKVHIYAGSGGCTAAINWARANPTLVASMYLICPLVDVEDFFNNWTNSGANGTAANPSGITQAEMQTAYGGAAAFTAAMPTHNPIRAASPGVPMRLRYATDDPFIPVQKVLDYAAATGASVASQGAVGHTGLGIDPADVVSFFRSNS